MTALLEVDGLTKRFAVGDSQYVSAATDVSFEIGEGETLGLVGESGSGKTTIGRCVLRLLGVDGGRVILDGQDITHASSRELRALRHTMQIVFQDPFGALNPRWAIGAIVAEPLKLRNGHDPTTDCSEAAVIATLERVGLDRGYLRALPADLTVGEQQRVGIARAVATKPRLVVLDEPTSALDPHYRAEILQLLADLQNELGISYLFISHDLLAVADISRRVAVMYLSRVVELGPTRELLANPQHPYTRALLSAVLPPDPDVALPRLTLQGEIPSAIDLPEECPFASRCPHAVDQCRAGVPPLVDRGPSHSTACIRLDELPPPERSHLSSWSLTG